MKNLVSELRNMAASTWAEKYEHDAVLEAAANELERLQKFEAGFGPPGEPVSAHEPSPTPAYPSEDWGHDDCGICEEARKRNK